MPANKIITLNCPDAMLPGMAAALRLYADAAYPPGASECAQVSRAALMDAAEVLEGPQPVLKRRMRAMTKAALEYYFQQLAEQEGRSMAALAELSQQAARGQAISDADLKAALENDATA